MFIIFQEIFYNGHSTSLSIAIVFLFSCISENHRTCPNDDPNFKQLVAFATQNFDTFEDQGTTLDDGSRKRVDRNNLDQFYDYHYRRTRKPHIPLPDFK